ncbi:hypothetical protein [Ferruginibacter sp.]
MKLPLIHTLKEKARQVHWLLLVFLILVLNVKLVIKVVAVIIGIVLNRKDISLKNMLQQRYCWFYFSMIGIGIINVALQYKSISTAYLATAALGVTFWAMSAVIAYLLYTIVKNEAPEKLHTTVSLFFLLHAVVIFFNFAGIMFETGSINPYTYKGLNQKYYISTGDFISGISFDAPVTTAVIAAFGMLYFLYRRQFLLCLVSMAALLLIASNFTNLILIAVLVFAFIFYSNKLQKSCILICLAMLVLFMAKISPQNNEHVGRIFYHLIDKPYDLPPEKVIPLSVLKKEPDSVLSFDQRKLKYAQNYIDSMSAIRLGVTAAAPTIAPAAIVKPVVIPGVKPKDSGFFQFHESVGIVEKINRYSNFIAISYDTVLLDSLKKMYDWKKPGKWIAGKELFAFLKTHPSKILTGDGIANFASRLAFKATLLNTAGAYPARLKYIHPDFLYNHLYLYLYYHSKDQSQHEASNTPDAVYYQVAGEYGLLGIASLVFLYFGFFLKRARKMSFGLPLLLVLGGAFFAEYWFEQFSIVVLFELLFFLDMKELRREEHPL